MREVLLIAGLFGLAGCADEAAENAAIAPSEMTEVEPEMVEDTSMDRRVMIGRDGPQMDACGSMGRITAETPVRHAPNDAAPVGGTIKAGRPAIACDATKDGAWLGIVYHPSIDDLNGCGTGSPVASEQPYRGACSSGWIRAEQYELTAG